MRVLERLAFPGALLAALLELPAPRTAAIRQRGIVADWTAWGKRKVCEGIHGGPHAIHSFSTSTRIVQFRQPKRYLAAILE